MIGHTLGHYRIVEKIGEGGMGVVYRALDERLNRDVALKILPPGMLANAAAVKSFREEAQALSRLNHPNIATIHDFDAQDELNFLVMEYVQGATLHKKISAGPLPEREVIRLGTQLAQGLQAAHGKGVIHRDLKPGNLAVTADRHLKILDFGLARLSAPSDPDATQTWAEIGPQAGTLPYMAPEQLQGQPADERSDIYSAGAVLYEMATGQRVFPDKYGVRLSDAILHRAVRPPRDLNNEISPDLQDVIQKALDKDPERRYQSAKELKVDLQRLPLLPKTYEPGTDQEPTEAPLEIAHVLYMDIVEYSKFPMDQQKRLVEELQKSVRATAEFSRAKAKDNLISLPSGDGMALVFFNDPESPCRCALELSRALRNRPEIKLRMGIHAGLVYRTADINTNRNVSGGGINRAQRVMDCGDAGHILVSKAVADMLAEVSSWNGFLHDLGEIEVKHGSRIHLFNLHTEDAGNPRPPTRLISAPPILDLRKLIAPLFALGRRATVGLSVFAATLGLVVGLVFWRLGGFGKSPRKAGESSSASTVAAVPVVGVSPFENVTGDRKFEWYGEGLADLIADNLAASRSVRVASTARVRQFSESRADKADLVNQASKQGIGYLVRGEIMGMEDSLTVSLRMIDTSTGREVAAHQVSGLTQRDLITAVTELSLAARSGLGIPLTESVDTFAADFATNNPRAYESYVSGLKALYDFNYADSERDFLDALNKAPTYTMARYRLATVYAATGRTDDALTEINKASTEALRLADREARYIRAAQAYYSRNYDSAIQQYKDMITKFPYEAEPRELLAQIYIETGQFEKGLDQAKMLSQIAPQDHEPWALLAYAQLGLRHFDEALAAADQYVKLEPKSANGHDVRADLLRAKAQLDAAASEYAKALEVDPAFYGASVKLAEVDYFRGKAQEAERRLNSLMSNNHVPVGQRIDAAFDMAYLLRSQERFRESAKLLQRFEKALAEEQVRSALAYSVRATSWMEVGDYQTARSLADTAIDRSPGVPTRYLFARGLLELRQGNTPETHRTADEISKKSLPADNPDRTEDKAAAYLHGMAHLAEGQIDRAVKEISSSCTLSGYEYSKYKLGLATAYLEAGELREAEKDAREVLDDLDLVEPRMDLELDRNRSKLLLAQIEMKKGNNSAAAARALVLRDLWSHADADAEDLRLLITLRSERTN